MGATKEIQSAEEGGSPLKLVRARKDFQSHFSRSLLGDAFGVQKRNLNKKDLWVRTFKIDQFHFSFSIFYIISALLLMNNTSSCFILNSQNLNTIQNQLLEKQSVKFVKVT